MEETQVKQATANLLERILKEALPYKRESDEGFPTAVVVRDAKSNGGAHHEYVVIRCNDQGEPARDVPVFAKVQFQKGPRKLEINGCTDADLIGIVVHRLACLQSGSHPSETNAKALTLLNMVLLELTSYKEAGK